MRQSKLEPLLEWIDRRSREPAEEENNAKQKSESSNGSPKGKGKEVSPKDEETSSGMENVGGTAAQPEQ